MGLLRGVVPPWAGGEAARTSQGGPNGNATRCAMCLKPFAMVIRTRKWCPLCERTLCGACCWQKMELDQVLFDEKRRTITACNDCKALVDKAEAIQQFQKEVSEAKDLPIVYYYTLLREIIGTINKIMPKYRRKVTMPSPDVHSLKMAGQLEPHLVQYFKNLQLGLVKMGELKVSGPDQQIQTNIRRGLRQFVVQTMQEFKMLQNQRPELMAKAEKEGRLYPEIGSGKRRVGGASGEQQPPHIKGVEPAHSPLQGTDITVSGENFIKGVRALIGGIECPTIFFGEDTLYCKSPPLPEGFHSVQVINPDGEDHKMDGIILYADEAGTSHIQSESLSPLLSRSPESAIPESAPSRPKSSKSRKTKSKGKANRGKRPTGPPQIKHVFPAISSINGTHMHMTGTNFSSRAVLKIGGRTVSTEFEEDSNNSATQKLKFLSPPLPKGFHDIEVCNPDGLRCVMEAFLLYTDDASLTTPSASDSRGPSHSSSTSIAHTPLVSPRGSAMSRVGVDGVDDDDEASTHVHWANASASSPSASAPSSTSSSSRVEGVHWSTDVDGGDAFTISSTATAPSDGKAKEDVWGFFSSTATSSSAPSKGTSLSTPNASLSTHSPRTYPSTASSSITHISPSGDTHRKPTNSSPTSFSSTTWFSSDRESDWYGSPASSSSSHRPSSNGGPPMQSYGQRPTHNTWGAAKEDSSSAHQMVSDSVARLLEEYDG